MHVIYNTPFTCADTTEEDKPQQDAVALGMTTTNIMPTTFTVAWKVLAGDPDSVVRFEISIADASDRVLLSQSLPGQTRSFHLRGLEPGTEYRAVIQAFGASGRESAAPLAEARASAVTLVTDGTSSAITTTRGEEHVIGDSLSKGPDPLSDSVVGLGRMPCIRYSISLVNSHSYRYSRVIESDSVSGP